MMQINHVIALPVGVSLRERHTGRVLPLYTDRVGIYYVDAIHALQYEVHVGNMSDGRLEVIVSVDGRDVRFNRPANLNDRGMAVPAGETYAVPGWGERNTTPFIFTYYDRKTMLAMATGRNDNLGVIAVAAYKEYEPPQRPSIIKGSYELFSSGPMRGSEKGSLRGSGVGTGTDFDDVTHRNLSRTTFRRANYDGPDALVQIYAKPHWWLVEHGIITSRPSNDADHPSGFPGSKHGDYFRG